MSSDIYHIVLVLSAEHPRIVPDLDNCTNSDKKDAYTYLDLEIKATPEGADIKGYVQLKLLTTARISGCLPFHAYSCLIPFSISI